MRQRIQRWTHSPLAILVFSILVGLGFVAWQWGSNDPFYEVTTLGSQIGYTRPTPYPEALVARCKGEEIHRAALNYRSPDFSACPPAPPGYPTYARVSHWEVHSPNLLPAIPVAVGTYALTVLGIVSVRVIQG